MTYNEDMNIFNSKLFSFFKREEKYRRGLIFSLLINFVSKIFGFLVTILSAFYFGSNEKTDILFFAMVSTSLITSFFVNLNSTVIIPDYMRLRDGNNKEKAEELIVFTFLLYLLITAICGICIFLFPKWWFNLFSKFKGSIVSVSVDLLRITGPFLVISTINMLLIDIINSFKRFSLPMISGLIANIVNVLLIVVFNNAIGISSIIAGALAGSGCQFIILFYSSIRLCKIKKFLFRFPFSKEKIKYIIISQGAYLFSLLASFVPFYILSGYPSGIISAITYGQRFVDIFSLIFISQFSNVLAIKLNELSVSNREDLLSEAFSKIGKNALFLSIPFLFLVSVLSFEGISIVFLRGKFRIDEAKEAATFVKIFVFVIPLLIINTMNARLIMAVGKVDKSFVFQIFSSLSIILLCVIFIQLYGPIGYPLAIIIGYLINLVLVKFLFDRIVPFLKGYYKLLLFGLKIVFFNILILPIDLKIKKISFTTNIFFLSAIIVVMHLFLFYFIAYIFKCYFPFNLFIDSIIKKLFKQKKMERF
ncbi:MAG: MATE family efflux transporter [Chitinispirillaceae bacterium]|nr:MATE family efflux transporter [Chitinispirillaceae bacterium]